MFAPDTIARVRAAVFAVTRAPFPGAVDVEQASDLSVEMKNGRARICAQDVNALARGFFLLSRAVKEGKKALRARQRQRFASCGEMLDCSRGGVLTVAAAKRAVDRLACLGMNLLLLYTEDTYTVPEYPYMGYLRGRYSPEELREIDDYAFSMGVELVPCIQMLAHLGQFLQWKENADMKDQPTILLAGEKPVYRFLEAEVRAMRACVRSKRIHIGMDEAHGVGLGRYYDKHGPEDRVALLNRHLSRAVEICEQYDFHPMMWSDMYFRLGSKNNEYYDLNASFGPEMLAKIPNVDLAYWDYYHTDEAVYDQMLALHERMGKTIAFAGGVWTWSGFLPHVRLTRATMRPALKQCARHGVNTVIATLWADDGAETEFSLADCLLPIFSEACWQGEDCPEEEIALAGECLTGLSREAFEAFGEFYPGIEDRRTGKGLVWCDLLYPLMEYEGDNMSAALGRCEKAMRALSPYENREDCRYALLLFKLCAQKAEILKDLRARYLAGDRAYLESVAEEAIPRLQNAYDALMRAHRRMWEAHRKRFGWELMSLRYGAVCGRLTDVQDEIRRYLAGELASIVELNETPLPSERKGGMQYFQVYVSPAFSL